MTAPGQVEAEATRKVKAAGSHAESPERQMQKLTEDAAKVPVGGGDVPDASSVEGMFMLMMKKMDKVEMKVDNIETKVDSMATKVDGAVQAANEAKEGVKQVEAQMEVEKNNRETWQAGMEERFTAIEFAEPAEEARPVDPEIQKKLADIEKKLAGMSASDPWARARVAADLPSKASSAAGAYGGKGGAKGDAKIEKRQRSITFSNFLDDTKEADITTSIWKVLEATKAEIEEVFCYSKHDSVGVARFKTSEGMWKYMQANAGKHRHTILGRTIYVNADRMAAPTEDEDKDYAVRKFVRAIIECNGGDATATETKKQIDAKYRKGIVIWRHVRVAEWCPKQQKLILKEDGLQYKNAYDVLMQPKTAE